MDLNKSIFNTCFIKYLNLSVIIVFKSQQRQDYLIYLLGWLLL